MPAPIRSKVMSLLMNQFHQVAIYTEDQGKAVSEYVKLGYVDWIHDEAELCGLLYGQPVKTKARMSFNYDIMPMELEFLTYYGPSRHTSDSRKGDKSFISHMSTYVDDIREDVGLLFDEYGMKPYHRFITQNHSNPAVAGKKRFIEAIYDTRSQLGYDLKLIEKVPHYYDDSEWLNWAVDAAI